MKITKTNATILVLVFCIVAVSSVRLALTALRNNFAKTTVLARVKGNPKALVRIVEYLDFQCPACAKGGLLIEEYMKKYPSKIRLEVKYYPITQIHTHALKSTLYSECAARQGKFWEFHHFLLKEQSRWERLIDVDAAFLEKAKDLRIDLDKLQACVDSEEARTLILDEKEQAKNLGVKSTPTYFINDKMLVGPKSLKDELHFYFGGKSN